MIAVGMIGGHERDQAIAFAMLVTMFLLCMSALEHEAGTLGGGSVCLCDDCCADSSAGAHAHDGGAARAGNVQDLTTLVPNMLTESETE